MKNFNKVFAVAILLITLVSCSRVTEHSQTDDVDSFEIHIGEWNRTVFEANLGYTVDSSWSLLKEWYPTGTTFTIKTADIEKYDWNKHILTLTPEASASFRSAFESPKYRMVFVVTVKDKPLYGGIFMFRQSEEGISFPVIYADSKDGKTTFTIRPRHSIFDDYKPSEDWHGIDNPLVKEVLSKAGKID